MGPTARDLQVIAIIIIVVIVVVIIIIITKMKIEMVLLRHLPPKT